MTRRSFVSAPLALSVAQAVRPQRILGANDRIGIGVIGCGNRNLLRRVLEFRKEANFDVRGVCDIWRQQREKASAQTKEATGIDPRQVHSYEDLLAMQEIDAVLIGTPDHQHCAQLVAAIRAAKDAYVEKPLAMSMKELRKTVDTVKKSDRIVQMGTQVRSYPSVRGAREFIRSGRLGKLYKIEQSRNGYRPYWHRYGERTIQASDTDWKAFLMHRKHRPWNADQYAAWYGYREFSRGPHSNLMVHFIDLVHHMTGASAPARVTAMGGIYRWKDSRTAPDSVEVTLEYPEEGFLVRYCSAYGVATNSYLKFFGTRGTMDGTRWSRPFRVSGQGCEEADRIAGDSEIAEMESTPHMLNWLQCLRSRQQPAAPIDAGYAHSVAVIMADESLVRGRRMVYNARQRAIRAG